MVDGKCALIWMLGEFGESIEAAPYYLESFFINNYEEEMDASIRLILLSSTLKLFFKRPPEMQAMLGGWCLGFLSLHCERRGEEGQKKKKRTGKKKGRKKEKQRKKGWTRLILLSSTFKLFLKRPPKMQAMLGWRCVLRLDSLLLFACHFVWVGSFLEISLFLFCPVIFSSLLFSSVLCSVVVVLSMCFS